MRYDEALDHLESLLNYETTPRAGAIEGLSLEPMLALMGALGDPQHGAPVIHVTGTNGKGSTIAVIEALLTAMGLRVGVYTSPHLDRVNERIRIGGEPVGDELFAQAIGDVARAVAANDLSAPTWFETVTAAALLTFTNEAVDVAVVEVGMLGRYDATNVVAAQVAVVTNVGKDHTDGEGDWKMVIAAEKAGIIEPTSSLVLGETDAELVAIFLAENPDRAVVADADFSVVQEQLAVGGRLISARTPWSTIDDVFLSLHGSHQATNAVVALAAVEEFFAAALPTDVVEEAFGSVAMPGRLEVVHRSPLVVVDTAHNASGAEVLADAVESDFGEGSRRYLVLGMQDGRDPQDVCEALRVGGYELVVVCTAPSARAVPAEELAAAVTAAGGSVEIVSDVEAAVDYAVAQADETDMVVVAGSNTVVAGARAVAEEL